MSEDLKQPISRAKMCGRKLDDDCKKAGILRHEFGLHDLRCFCYGLIDDSTEDYLKKCINCGAFTDNAKPLKMEGENEDPCEVCHNALQCLVWAKKKWKAECDHWGYFEQNYVNGPKRAILDAELEEIEADRKC